MTITERNQQNAQHSQGPTTPEGKARSSQNALKTGLYSSNALLPTEDAEQFRRHNESYVLEYNPQGATQRDLVQSISDDAWCLLRIRKLVAAQHARLARFDAPDAEPCKMEYRSALIRGVDLLGRHEQRTRNAVNKTIKLLKELQKQPRQPIPVPVAKPQSGFVPNTHSTAGAATPSTPVSVSEIRSEPTPTGAIPLAADGKEVAA